MTQENCGIHVVNTTMVTEREREKGPSTTADDDEVRDRLITRQEKYHEKNSHLVFITWGETLSLHCVCVCLPFIIISCVI